MTPMVQHRSDGNGSDESSPGAVLAALRERARLTQEQLAVSSGVAVRTIRNLERGPAIRPRWTTVRLLARALETDETDLMRALDPVAPDARPRGGVRRLPAAVGDFTGRAALAARVGTILTGGTVTGAATVVDLSGRAGVGKSCLATVVGHQLAGAFPDGRLWVDLGGSGRTPRSPGAVLGDLLLSLGLDAAALPDGTAQRTELLAEQLAGRRILLVLDDAADEAQVEPLLPSPPAAALVTSRRPLARLAGVSVLEVETLPPVDGAGLLERILGSERAAAEPAELRRIVAACAGLPLALRIAGARLVARPHVSLRSLATALADEHRRLAELRYADLEVRAPLQSTLEGLTARDRRAFALLGRLDVPHLPLAALEAVLDLPPAGAERAADRLVDARLLDAASVRDSADIHYRFHDLLQLFARQTPVGAQDWRAALHRLAGRLLVLAGAADAALPGTSDVLIRGNTTRRPVAAATLAPVRADPEGWFLTEERVIQGVVAQLLDTGQVEPAWELAAQIRTFGLLQGRREVWRSTHETVLAACEQAGDVRGAASMLFGLGKLRHEEHRLDEPEPVELAAAARAFHELGELAAESRARGEIASWYGWIGAGDRAEDHAVASLRLARQSGSDEVLADALFVLGRLRLRAERWAEAGRLFDEACVLCHRIDKPRSAAQALWQRAVVVRAEHDLGRSESLLEEAVAAVRSVRDQHGEARILIDLGDVCTEAGHLDRAAEHLEEALILCDQAQAPNFRALALVALSRVHERRGDLADAVKALEESLQLWRSLHDTARGDQAAADLDRLRAQSPA
jgi:tetratricopeptide (TPR) repeat protein/DNA-binding XRE family transcriptional regulator